MTATYSQMLDEAKDGLLALLEKRISSYTLGPTTYTYDSLEDLRKMIDWLESKVAFDTSGRQLIIHASVSGRPGA
jgi:hypothetical protein